MNMASNDMNERLLEKIFDDLLEQGTDPKDAEIKAREIFNEMGDTSSMPDRGAPSIKLADGGITRIGLKDGFLARLMSGVKPDGGMFRSLFANRNAPVLSGFNTSELFDMVSQISSLPGLYADGGRIGYKDGPKDPRRRGFMKAAVGVASMLPFGIGKGIKMAAPAIERGAEIAGPALAKIVETVMSLGKTISQSGKRVKEMVTKKKHKGVEVEEDVMDGSYIIKKDNKEIYFKPGRRDEMGIDDDIIEVIEKTVTKKADGGRIGYSIGDRVMPNDFMNLGLANITQGQNTQTAGLLDMFKDTPQETTLEEIQDLRKQENQIKGLGEGAIELKQDELKDIEQKIQNLKNQYPEDENIQQAFDPYADIQGQTAGLGVASFLAEKFGPKIGAAIFNYGKNKVLNKSKNVFIDKPIQKILTTSGGSAANASIYNGGYRGGRDSSGKAVSFDSAPGTTTFDSKSGRGRRDYQQGGIARLLGE